MQKKYTVSSSPHLRDNVSTRRVMQDVCIALIPAGLAGVWFFGLRAAILIAVSVVSAVFSEWFYCKHAKRGNPIGDFSAVVTGLLVAYNLPASAPWWLAAIGSAIAIILVKQFFGGIGQNFMNPALAARAILLASWATLMTAWVAPQGGNWMAGMGGAVDAVSSATPLQAQAGTYSLFDLFIGNCPGTLGETSKLALLIGAAYLFARRVINWRIPVTFIGTALILFWIQTGTLYSADAGTASALYQVMSGGLMLGALFMATDYSSSPVTPWGQIIFGVGCGVMLFVIRAFNSSMPEGCSYAILFMNVVAPLIERVTSPKSFGEVKSHA
ncbi:RnfABCDGE type electron transport complex subunit D [Beduinella massiliensis]|uniref:RnfABCDGE type electron transport complex subunit D n=1 Tax=Beduinella massiliensis TaxID=1852363 RepID=UPI000C83ED5C